MNFDSTLATKLKRRKGEQVEEKLKERLIHEPSRSKGKAVLTRESSQIVPP